MQWLRKEGGGEGMSQLNEKVGDQIVFWGPKCVLAPLQLRIVSYASGMCVDLKGNTHICVYLDVKTCMYT